MSAHHAVHTVQDEQGGYCKEGTSNDITGPVCPKVQPRDRCEEDQRTEDSHNTVAEPSVSDSGRGKEQEKTHQQQRVVRVSAGEAARSIGVQYPHQVLRGSWSVDDGLEQLKKSFWDED